MDRTGSTLQLRQKKEPQDDYGGTFDYNETTKKELIRFARLAKKYNLPCGELVVWKVTVEEFK